MGLLQKLYNSFKNRSIKKNSELGPEGIKYLKKLASKFGTAIEKRAGGVQLSQIGDEKEEEEEGTSNVRSKIVVLDNGNTYVYADRNVINSNTVDGIRQDVSNFFKSLLKENNSLDIPTIEGDTLTITKAETADKARDNYKAVGGVPVQMTDAEFALKGRIEAHIDEIAETAIKENRGRTADTKSHPFAKDGFSYRTAYFEDFDGSYYKLRLSIGHNGTTATVYNVGKIEKGTLPSAKIIAVVGSKAPVENASDDSISENEEKINSSDERSSKNRSYDPKNGKEPTFEEAEGGVKINFHDFEPHKSNDNSNDFEAVERARRESFDALLKNGEPPRYSPVSANADTELLRRVVNNTKAKKYTRADVKAIVTELLNSEGYFGDNTVVMKGKKRAELEKMLWQALNTKGEGELGGAALDAAEYIIQNAIAVEYLEVTDDIQLAVQFVDALKPYLHNMNLDFIKGDIKTKFDKDNTPYLMWAVKKDGDFRGYTADEVAQELEALGFKIDKTNEADIFLEIDKLYRLAKQAITDAVPAKDTLLNALGTEKAKKLKQALVKDILTAQEEKGTETSFYKLQQKYIKQIAELGEKVRNAHKRNTLENRILKEAKKIYDSNKHTFANATEVQTEALKNIKKLLSRVNSREQVNRSSLRAIMKELAIWYSEKNPVLEGFYDNYIAEHLAYFAETVGEEGTTPPSAELTPPLTRAGNDATVPAKQFLSKFGRFSEQQIKNWENSDKIIVAESESQVEDFVKSAMQRDIVGKKMLIGVLPSDVVSEIKKSTGVDLTGFNFELRADELLHIKNQHGNAKGEANRGQKNIDVQEIMNIIEVVTNFDSVKVGDKQNSLVFEKKIDGVYHAVTYYAYGNKSIYPHTLYITKKGGLAQTNNASDKNSHPVRNVQDGLSTATDNSITENSQNVKREKPLSMGELKWNKYK